MSRTTGVEGAKGANKAGDMTTKNFKNKAQKEMSEEETDMGYNFHKNNPKNMLKIKAKKKVPEKYRDMDNKFFENGIKAKSQSRKL